MKLNSNKMFICSLEKAFPVTLKACLVVGLAESLSNVAVIPAFGPAMKELV